MTIRVKRAARLDMASLRSWSEANWGEARTRDYLVGLREALRQLDRNPGIGRPRDHFAPGLRSWAYRRHVIFYVAKTGGVISIVRVLHERRNHAALDFADEVEGDL